MPGAKEVPSSDEGDQDVQRKGRWLDDCRSDGQERHDRDVARCAGMTHRRVQHGNHEDACGKQREGLR